MSLNVENASEKGGGGKLINIVALIVVGLVAGVLAKWAMPGPSPGGILVTIIIGIAGSFAGEFIVNRLFGGSMTGGISLGSILIATLGAIVLLAIYRTVTRWIV